MSVFFKAETYTGECQYLVTSPENLRKDLRKASEKGVEITITFQPLLTERWRPETLTVMVNDQFKKYSTRYKFTVVLIGEFSKTGLYHMHGSILAEGKMLNSIRRNFPKQFGRTEIKAIRFSETWIQYVLKKDDDDREHEKPLYNNQVVWYGENN